MRGVERLPRFFLLEQVGDDIAAGSQADLVPLDFGNQSLWDEMMVLLVAFAAVGPDELDAIVFDSVDRADVSAIGADYFHMFANVFEAAHG